MTLLDITTKHSFFKASKCIKKTKKQVVKMLKLLIAGWAFDVLATEPGSNLGDQNFFKTEYLGKFLWPR